MNFFKKLTLSCCCLLLPIMQASATEVEAVQKVYVADFEYVHTNLVKVASVESTLAVAEAIKGSGESRGWFIGFPEAVQSASHSSSLPWWLYLSLAALILVPQERRITRSTQRFLAAMQ